MRGKILTRLSIDFIFHEIVGILTLNGILATSPATCKGFFFQTYQCRQASPHRTVVIYRMFEIRTMTTSQLHADLAMPAEEAQRSSHSQPSAGQQQLQCA